MKTQFARKLSLMAKHRQIGALAREGRLHAVQQAMVTLGLSPALQLRIVSYFTYERLHRSHVTFDALFQRLSPQLRFELHLYLYTAPPRRCHPMNPPRSRRTRSGWSDWWPAVSSSWQKARQRLNGVAAFE